MYTPIRKADLVVGGTSIKQGEIFTLGFQLFDANGVLIIPEVGHTITVKIANKIGVVYETTALVVDDHVEFTVSENIGAGKMRVEFKVTDGANVLQKYPANGYIELLISASLDDLAVAGIYVVTAQEMFTRIEGSETASATAVADAGEALTIAGAVRDDFDLVVAEAGASNPEIVLARGGEATLQARLDKTTSSLAEKAEITEVRRNTTSFPINVEEMDTETKALFTGGSVAVVGINSTGTENLKNKSATEEKVTFLDIDQRNIYNKYRSEDGFRLGTTGGKIVDATYTLSDFTPVTNGQTVKIGFSTPGYLTYRICGYDANKGFVKQVTPTISDVAVAVIDVVIDFDGFIRVPFQLTGKNIALIADSVVYEGFRPYEVKGVNYLKTQTSVNSVGASEVIDKAIAPSKTDFAVSSKNMFDKSKTSIGFSLNAQTGEPTASSTYTLSEFIPVDIGISYPISNPRNVSFYSEGKQHLPNAYVNNSGNAPIVVTAPQDGFLRTSFLTTYTDTFQVEKGAVHTAYDVYGVTLPNMTFTESQKEVFALYGNTNPLAGKKLIMFGDSIADAMVSGVDSLGQTIVDDNGMLYTNYASSGAVVAPRAGFDNEIIKQVNTAITASATTDYILFNGLTNDANVLDVSKAGVITAGYNDTLDLTTFAGAFENLVKTIINQWENAKIIYFRVHNMDSRDSRQKTYGDLVTAICKKWSIPMVDLYNEGGMNTQIASMKQLYTIDTYATGLGDGTHPNVLGYERYYIPRIVSKMKSI